MFGANQLCGFGAGGAGLISVVGYDAGAEDIDSGAGYSQSVTVPDGALSAVVFVSTYSGGGALRTISAGPTLNGAAMTGAIGGPTSGNEIRSWYYYINNPTSGTLAVTFSGSILFARVAAVFFGATIASVSDYTTDITDPGSVAITPTPTSGIIMWGAHGVSTAGGIDQTDIFTELPCGEFTTTPSCCDPGGTTEFTMQASYVVIDGSVKTGAFNANPPHSGTTSFVLAGFSLGMAA